MMGDLVVRIVTKDEAAALKEHAILVMRSARRLPACACERALLDGRSCVKCGRPIPVHDRGRKLMRAVQELDRLFNPSRPCSRCASALTYIEGSDRMASFYWCEQCGRATA